MKHLSGRTAAWIVIALIIASVHGEASAEKTPSAEKVLDRFVEVTGGQKAYDALENRKTSASMSIPAQGMTFTINIWLARPNQIYSEIENAMIGKVRKGVSGDVVWENSIMTGPVIKEGPERENTLRESAFERFVYWRDNFGKAEMVGEEAVGGIDCWKVVLTPEAGESSTLFFEKDSGLLAKVVTVTETEMGKIPVEASLSDYREVDGIKVSFKTTVNLLGQERILTVKSIEHNVEMPEGIFGLPEEIKALQE